MAIDPAEAQARGWILKSGGIYRENLPIGGYIEHYPDGGSVQYTKSGNVYRPPTQFTNVIYSPPPTQGHGRSGGGYYSPEAQRSGNLPSSSRPSGTKETVIQGGRAYEVTKDVAGNVINVSNAPTPELVRTVKQLPSQLSKSEIETLKRTPVGAIVPFSQAAAQKRILESPTAQFKSPESYQKLVEQFQSTAGRAGGKIRPLDVVSTGYEPPKPGEPGYHGTKERPQGLYNPTIKNELIPLFDKETGKPNVIYTDKDTKNTFIRDPKYGLMIRKDMAAREAIPAELRSNLKSDDYLLTPIARMAMEFSKNSVKYIEEKAGYTSESNIFKKAGVGVAEAVVSIPEFLAVLGLGGEIAIGRSPLKYVASPLTSVTKLKEVLHEQKETGKAAGAGLILTVGALEQGLTERPIETLSGMLALQKVGAIGSKFYSKSPIKAGKVAVPVSGAEKIAQVWKGVYTDVKGAKPIVGLGESLKRVLISQGGSPEASAALYTTAMKRGIPLSEIGVKVAKPNVILGSPKASQIPPQTFTGFKSAINELHEARRGYFPQSKIETSIITQPDIMTKLGYSAIEQNKIAVARELTGIVEKGKTAFQERRPVTIFPGVEFKKLGSLSKYFKIPKITYNKPTFMFEAESLPETGVRGTVKFAAEKGKGLSKKVHDIGGSFAQQPQVMTKYRRLSGDIDLHTYLDTPGALDLAKELHNRLKPVLDEAGFESKIEGTTIVTKKAGGKFKHAVQVLPEEAINIEESGMATPDIDLTYGFKTHKPTIKIEGAPTTQLSEQAIRKMQGVLRFGKEKIYPVVGREKDIPDFYRVHKSLVESLTVKKGTPRISVGTKEFVHEPKASIGKKAIRGRQLLEDWKKLYPEVDWAAVEGQPTTLPPALRQAEKVLFGSKAAGAILISGKGIKSTSPRQSEKDRQSVSQYKKPIDYTPSSPTSTKQHVPVKSYSSAVSYSQKYVSDVLKGVPDYISGRSPRQPQRRSPGQSRPQKPSNYSSLPSSFKSPTSPNISKIEKILSPVSKSPVSKSPVSKSPGQKQPTSPPSRYPSTKKQQYQKSRPSYGAAPAVRPTTTTTTQQRPKTVKLFKSALGDLKKAKKDKKGKYAWDIVNDIPTLESVLGGS